MKIHDAAREVIGSKKIKTKHRDAHTDNVKYGMGDHYGTGFKAPMGKLRSDTIGMNPVPKKKLGVPPKSVV